MSQKEFLNESQATQDLREIANFMDTKYRGPFGFRFGWDGLLGFIPGVGDAVTSLFSFYIIFRSAWIGCPPAVLGRMGLNVLIDNVLSAVPVLGFAFDFMWKSNIMNIALLESYLQNPRGTTWSSRFLVIFVLLFILALMGATVYFTVIVLHTVLGFLRSAW